MVKKNILLAIIASVLMGAGVAKAETVTSGNWSLNISVAASGDKVCVATTTAGSATTDYQLAIATSEVSPIQITMKALGQGDMAKTIVSNLEGSQALMSSAASADGQQYWYIPNNSGDLIKAIKSKWQLPFHSVGNASQGVAFSLSGSSAILNFMEAECNNGLKLENDVLLNKLPAKRMSAATLSASKVKSLRLKYFKAHQALMGLEQAEIAIVDLESEFQDDLAKKDQIVQTKNYLAKTLIPSLVKEQSDIKVAIPKQRREASQLEAKVPALQSALNAAKNKYQSLESELRPLLAQERQLMGDVSSYADDINSSERAIGSLSSEIESRRSESHKMKQRLGGIQSELEKLKRKQQEIDRAMEAALRAKRAFKPRERVSKRLAGHSEYQRLQSSIQQSAQKKKQLSGEVSRLSSKLQQDKKAFQACKKAKKPDCSPQKKKVDATSAQLSQKKKELKAATSALKQKQGRSGKIKKDVQREVDSKFKKIQAKANEATERSRKIKKKIESLRQDAIRLRRKLESVRSTLADLKFSLDSERASLQSARSRHQSAKQSLASLRQRHNIAAKERQLSSAEAKYSQAHGRLTDTQDFAASLRHQASSGEARLVSAKRQEADSRQELAEVKAQEIQVDRGLKEYNAKKKTLDASLLSQQKSVGASVVAYRSTL